MTKASQLARYLWAAPASALGVILGAVGIAGGGRMSLHTGVLEVEGRLLAWGLTHLTWLEDGATAITFGHVVLARDAASLEWTRGHERVHVRQYERWGPMFIPLYVAASAWVMAGGRDPYWDNPFEREAREVDEAGPVDQRGGLLLSGTGAAVTSSRVPATPRSRGTPGRAGWPGR